MTHPVQKYLQDSGYGPGDALSGGPGSYPTLRMWAAVVAATLICIAAFFSLYEVGCVATVMAGAIFLSLVDASQSPPLRIEDAGIRRGDQLISWADVRACHRVITRNQAFIEFTFTDANGHQQTQRSLAAPALYRHLLEDNEAKPEVSNEASEEASLTRGDQATYRTAPPVLAPLVVTSKEPPRSWWRAFVRFFAG